MGDDFELDKGRLLDPWRTYENVPGIRYTLNSQGYRAAEFDQIDWNYSILLFGCSCTLGVGVDDSETIAVHLERLSGIPVINLGAGASAMTFSLYNQVALKELKIKPRAVVNLWTSISRLTYFTPNTAIGVGRWSTTPAHLRMLFSTWNLTDSNPAAHAKCIQRIAHLFWENTPYYEATFFENTAEALDIPLLDYLDRGQDQRHPGVKSTEAAANLIYENLKTQL